VPARGAVRSGGQRPRSRSDDHLASLRDDERFGELVGPAPADVEGLSRDEGWRGDLRLLAREVRRRAYAFPGSFPERKFDDAVDDLARVIPDSSDAQLVTGAAVRPAPRRGCHGGARSRFGSVARTPPRDVPQSPFAIFRGHLAFGAVSNRAREAAAGAVARLLRRKGLVADHEEPTVALRAMRLAAVSGVLDGGGQTRQLIRWLQQLNRDGKAVLGDGADVRSSGRSIAAGDITDPGLHPGPLAKQRFFSNGPNCHHTWTDRRGRTIRFLPAAVALGGCASRKDTQGQEADQPSHVGIPRITLVRGPRRRGRLSRIPRKEQSGLMLWTYPVDLVVRRRSAGKGTVASGPLAGAAVPVRSRDVLRGLRVRPAPHCL
jgi:hypothetical protein